MSATNHNGQKRYGVTFGKEFLFVNAATETAALERARVGMLRKAEDKLKGNEVVPPALLSQQEFNSVANVRLSTRS